MGQATRFLYRAVGAGIAIALMEALARLAHEPLARVPFVTSIVLTMGLPESEPAQPYAVIVGHLLSSIAGFVVLWAFGSGDVESAVAVGLAAFLMLVARAMHPPAGLDAFLIAGSGLPGRWMISPVLIGAILLAIYAKLWASGEARVLKRIRA